MNNEKEVVYESVTHKLVRLSVENNRLECRLAAMLCLVEQLANEFMSVASHHGEDTFVGDEAFVCSNKRLAEQVNKVLGLVK